MRDYLARMRSRRALIGGMPLDIEGGVIAGIFCAVYGAVVGGVRGVSTDMMSGRALGLLVVVPSAWYYWGLSLWVWV